MQATANSLKAININFKINNSQIKKATASIKQLQTAMNAVKSNNVSIKLNTASLGQATRAVRGLSTALHAAGAARVNINVNAAGIQNALNRINALHNAARQPVRVNVGGAGVPGGPGGRVRGGFAAQGGTSNLSREIVRGILGAQTLHLAGHEAKEGLFAAGMAKTAMDLKPESLKAGAQTAITAIQNSQKQTGLVWANRAETEQLYADTMSITAGGGPKEASHLITQLQSLARLGSARGQTREQAMEGALDFARAAEQTGALYGAGGVYDEKKATEVFNTMRQLQGFIGKSFTGQKWRALMQAAGTSKYGMSAEGLMTVALLGQEQGTRAATGIDTLVKNLTGNVLTKQKKERLADLGLLDPEMVKGKGSVKDLVTKGATDEEGMRTYMLNWMHDRVFPAMQKQGMDPYTADPEERARNAGKFASLITSGKGAASLAGLIVQFANLTKDVKLIQQQSGTKEATDIITGKNPKVMYEALEGGVQDVLGQGLLTMMPRMQPMAEKLSATMSDLANNFATGQDTGLTLSKTLAAGSGAMLGLGMMNAVRAMMSSDPTAKALGSAAFALDSAAGVLLGAASAMAAYFGKDEQQKAKDENIRALTDGINKYQDLKAGEVIPTRDEINKEQDALRKQGPEAAKAIRQAYIEEQKSGVAADIGRLVTELNKMGLLPQTVKDLNDYLRPLKLPTLAPGKEPPKPLTVEELTQQAQEQFVAAQVKQAEEQRDALKKTFDTLPADAKATDTAGLQKTKLLEEINARTLEIDRLKQELKPKPTEPAPVNVVALPPELRPVPKSAFGTDADSFTLTTMPKTLANFTKGMDAASATIDTIARQYMATQPKPGATDTGWDVKQQGAIPGDTGDIAGTVDRFSAVIGEFSAAGSSVASSIEGSSSSLIAAGTTAAGTIAAGASAAGSAYGAAAAAQISAAAAKVSISVNTNTTVNKAPNAGTQVG